MKDTEIEIQVRVTHTQPLLEFLKRNAKEIGTQKQIDEYFTPKHRSFIRSKPIREWLRLRKSDTGSFITYKNWKYDASGKSWHCDEYETRIENTQQLRKIFFVLNFKHLTTVDKKRQIWKYKSFEISIDNIKSLGNFVEMEYKSKKKAKVKEVVNEMVTFLKNNGCGKIERNNGGYPFMLMFPKKTKFEEL